MTPYEMMGARLLGADGPSEEQMRQYQEAQRIALIEMYRQATAQQCLVAMIVKSMAREMADDSPVPIKSLARKAKEAADALCVEVFGEESLT